MTPGPVCTGAPSKSVMTTPAARHSAMPAVKCTLRSHLPSVTYASLRPAATHASASVVDSTRGLNVARKAGSAASCAPTKSRSSGPSALMFTRRFGAGGVPIPITPNRSPSDQ